MKHVNTILPVGGGLLPEPGRGEGINVGGGVPTTVVGANVSVSVGLGVAKVPVGDSSVVCVSMGVAVDKLSNTSVVGVGGGLDILRETKIKPLARTHSPIIPQPNAPRRTLSNVVGNLSLGDSIEFVRQNEKV